MVALVAGPSRRDQIVAAVLDLVRSEGWAAISMRPVAERVGITATALYRHFEDKQALVDAALEAATDALMVRFQEASHGAPAGEGRLWAGLEEVRRFAVEEPHLYAFIFFSIDTSAATSPPDSSSDDRLIDALENHVDAWMNDVGITREAVEVASVVAAQAHGLVLLWRQGRFEGPEDFADFYREAFWIMLGGVENQ
ncbi:MAG: TetR/AcrR family transcriptional regulator [Gemmatimonadota bacterium]|nr:TetR/AcrR family transcriptional regulator [Gemmatimonadota bacterium]